MSLEVIEKKLWSPTQGRGQVIAEDGHTVLWEEDWQDNALADEGEESILNVWLREQAHPTKYMVVLDAAPSDTTTMATMDEIRAPGVDGYARQQVLAADWSAPALDGGDYQTQAAEKTFGPATSLWLGMTHVGLVTTSPGNTGKFLLYIALSATTQIAVGQAFKYTLRTKAQ